MLHKKQDVCVFDLDDFTDGNMLHMDTLNELKDSFPKLKVTLFAVPFKTSDRWLKMFSAFDWIEFAVHGYTHEPNKECLSWDKDDANFALIEAEASGAFVKGFRPPGWQMSAATLDVLSERGYWVAPHPDDRRRVERYEVPAYYAGWFNPLSVHGHMQDIHQDNPLLRNGLNQLIMERGLPWDGRTEFKFISEVVDE